MGSEDKNKSRNHEPMVAMFAVLPLRQKLMYISTAIIFFVTLFVASFAGAGEGNKVKYWMFDYNDFDEVSHVEEKDKSLVEFEGEDDIEALNDFASPEQLLNFRKASIYSRLVDDISSSESLHNSSSPQGMAFNFIVEDDKRDLHPDEELLIQRYALAVLYFATMGNEWSHGDLHFLSAVHECHWQKKIRKTIMGVIECDNMHVTHIQLGKCSDTLLSF